jgi:hypothetical protein
MDRNQFNVLTTQLNTTASRGIFVCGFARACATARRAAGAGLVGAALLGAAALACPGPATAQEDLLTPIPCEEIYCAEIDGGYSDAIAYAVDADGDGLSDGDELNTYGTDPNASDTDGDGYGDGYEIVPCSGGVSTNPLDPADYFDRSGCLN